jgi:cadmium resistance protein CadD (predicted permease)
LSADIDSSNDDSDVTQDYSIYRHAPRLVDARALISVLIGTFLGVYGLLNRNLSTASQQSLIGSVGYVLTVIAPIALLQTTRMRHDSALKVDEFLPNVVHAEWQKRKSNLLKIAAFGLASAALSITVFFWPIAQGFA